MVLNGRDINLKFVAVIFVLAMLSPIYFIALFNYSGSKLIYTIFTIIIHWLLVAGFLEKAIFFEAFIGFYFWLGFWLKFSIKVAFFDANFIESVGLFDGLPSSFDYVLLIVIVALSGLLISQYIRRYFFSGYSGINYRVSVTALADLYFKYRRTILFIFFVGVIFIGYTNYEYVIYQKGQISQSTMPSFINSVYKWLLIFGLSSFVSMFFYFEINRYRALSYLVIVLGLIESILSGASMLSRGGIFNIGALIYGCLVDSNFEKRSYKLKSIFILFSLILVLFIGSIYLVNYARIVNGFIDVNGHAKVVEISEQQIQDVTTTLFIDRWVGIEGVMAVSSLSNLGYDLLKRSFQEVYNEHQISFYDHLIHSNYINVDFNRHHFTSMPGLIAYLFYSGSLLFVFFSMMFLGCLASLIEIFSFKASAGNIIFASLIGQIIAYRFSNFGYVPNQTYLLISAILINSTMFYGFIKVATYAQKIITSKDMKLLKH